MLLWGRHHQRKRVLAWHVDVCLGVATINASACWLAVALSCESPPSTQARAGWHVDVCPGVATINASACWLAVALSCESPPSTQARAGWHVDVCPGVATINASACWLAVALSCHVSIRDMADAFLSCFLLCVLLLLLHLTAGHRSSTVQGQRDACYCMPHTTSAKQVRWVSPPVCVLQVIALACLCEWLSLWRDRARAGHVDACLGVATTTRSRLVAAAFSCEWPSLWRNRARAWHVYACLGVITNDAIARGGSCIGL